MTKFSPIIRSCSEIGDPSAFGMTALLTNVPCDTPLFS